MAILMSQINCRVLHTLVMNAVCREDTIIKFHEDKIVQQFQMPNIYKRKASHRRGLWSQEALAQAMNAVRNQGMSIRRASIEYNIPRKTLERRLKENNPQKGRMGPSSLFGEENEARIERHIISMQKRGFPLTRNDIRHIAYKFAEQLNIPHRFNMETEKAGYPWLQLFLTRHPNIRIRKTENVSLARSVSMNREEVQAYFELLQTILEENNLFQAPGKVFNMDETGVQLNSRPHQVLAAKGSKCVSTVSSSEKGETITIVACCNAEGVFLPPMCIMKGKNKKPELEDGLPPESVLYMNQKSAYINSDLFLKWLTEVFVPRKPTGKVILLLDGHTSHSTSVEMLEFAEANDVILLSLPSHTTHYLQPLDRAVFKSFEGYFYEVCRLWFRTHPERRITRYQFGQLLSQAWAKCATPENAISGFRATGVFPYNPAAIPNYAFEVYENQFQRNENAEQETEHVPETQQVSNQENTFEPQPGSSHAVSPYRETQEQELVQDQHKHQEENPEKETPSKILERISEVPKQNVQQTRKRSKSVACLLTSPEHVEKCKINQLKKQRANEKISKGKKKITPPSQPRSKKIASSRLEKSKKHRYAISESSSDSSTTQIEYDDESSGNEESEDEICMVCGEQGKSEVWYRCVSCGKWVHKLCSGKDTPKNYICDWCS